MYKSHLTGRLAELAIIIILKIKFYKIKAYRYRNRYGEIDIVASKNKTLFFIEVKSRSNKKILLESLQSKQIKRIKKAANYFISKRVDLQKMEMCFCAYYLSPWAIPKKIYLF